MGNFSELKDFLKDISTIIYNLLFSLSLIGTGVLNIWGEPTARERIISIIAMIIIAALMIIHYKFHFSTKKSLTEKDTALIQKDKEYEATLTRQKNELEEQRKEIQRLSGKTVVLMKALQSEIPPQVGFYVANKEKYDSFKTDLHLLKCDLDVHITKDDKSDDKYSFQFDWNLLVVNNDSLPTKEVKFIYSGEKNDNSFPEVIVEQDDEQFLVSPQLKQPELSPGDDRFITIGLPKPLEHKRTVKVHIHYTPPTYTPNRARETIWLAPDALGFAGISEFCIRVFFDGEIIQEATEGILRSYKISETYSVTMEDNQSLRIELKNNEKNFMCRKDRDLSGYAYLLILINNRDNLPSYLKNTPTKNWNEQNKNKG